MFNIVKSKAFSGPKKHTTIKYNRPSIKDAEKYHDTKLCQINRNGDTNKCVTASKRNMNFYVEIPIYCYAVKQDCI